MSSLSGPITGPEIWSSGDPELMRRLAQMWDELDPVPADVVTRTVFAVQLERLDAELLALQDDVLELTAVRSSEPMRTLSFVGGEVALMLTVTAASARGHAKSAPAVRVDGFVMPAMPAVVELRRDGAAPARARVDVHGRFMFPDVDPTLVQLIFRPDAQGSSGSGTRGTFACPAIRL